MTGIADLAIPHVLLCTPTSQKLPYRYKALKSIGIVLRAPIGCICCISGAGAGALIGTGPMKLIMTAPQCKLCSFLSKRVNSTIGRHIDKRILPDQHRPHSLRVCSFFIPTLPPSETCFLDFFFPFGVL